VVPARYTAPQHRAADGALTARLVAPDGGAPDPEQLAWDTYQTLGGEWPAAGHGVRGFVGTVGATGARVPTGPCAVPARQ
jgi:hypothetical protein